MKLTIRTILNFGNIGNTMKYSQTKLIKITYHIVIPIRYIYLIDSIYYTSVTNRNQAMRSDWSIRILTVHVLLEQGISKLCRNFL